jgi:hypothetical protein
VARFKCNCCKAVREDGAEEEGKVFINNKAVEAIATQAGRGAKGRHRSEGNKAKQIEQIDGRHLGSAWGLSNGLKEYIGGLFALARELQGAHGCRLQFQLFAATIKGVQKIFLFIFKGKF